MATATLFEARPAAEDRAIWDAIAARASTNLSPVLLAPSPPPGFDTVQGNVTDSTFQVEYRSADKRLRLNVGMVSNPPPAPITGHEEIIHFRGIDCEIGSKSKGCAYLRVRSDANPSESSSLIWYEQGHEVFPDAPDRSSVEYFLIGEGVDPQVLIDFAASLTESGQANTPKPVTRIPIPWPTP